MANLNFPFGFAYVAAGTAWSTALFRGDDNIFGFTLTQQEGAVAQLEIEIKNPRIGLNNPSRFQWAWFSWQDVAGELGTVNAIYPLFYGRVISYPNDFLGNAITVKLEARPLDFLVQKQTLAATLQVRPYWDPVFLTPPRRLDPDAVLEGYARMWHVDRTSLSVTISDLLVGEDGIVSLAESDAFWESVHTSIDKPPLRNVYVEGTVDWDQQDSGLIDMGTKVANTYCGDGILNGWPKPLASIGAGWSVQHASAVDTSKTALTTNTTTHVEWHNTEKKHQYGDTMSYTLDWVRPSFVTTQTAGTASASNSGHFILSQYNKIAVIDQDPDGFNDPTAEVRYTDMWVLPWTVTAQLVLRYEAKRHRTEQVRFTLAADLQPVFTDPGGQAANFAQDSELVSIQGSVGIEGPYGEFKGNWAAGAQYSLYDYFMVGTSAYMTTRDHLSAPSFDPRATASVWQAFTFYGAGENVLVGSTTYQVLISGLSASYFNPTQLGPDLTPVYQLQINPYAGPPLYQFLPNFRGNWATSTVYVSNDIFIGPDNYWYNVQVGHTSTSFARFNTDSTGRLLYGLLLNPAPIDDVSKPSYFPQDRGNWSLEYLIMLARAKLIFRSRAARISFDTHFHQLVNVTLRKSASIIDHRLPGGGAQGKIVAYSARATEEQGPVLNITIGCAVGAGNSVVPVAGTPTYGDTSYMHADYQAFSGQTVAIGSGAGDITYAPPVYNPNDDGLVFPLDKSQAVISESFRSATDMSGEIASVAQFYNSAVQQQGTAGFQNLQPNQYGQSVQGLHEAMVSAAAQALARNPYWYQLILKPVVNGPFSTEYDVTVSDLMIDKQIDLASASVP